MEAGGRRHLRQRLTLLDLDKLAADEHENWVWEGADCSPSLKRCLLKLSRGGGDAGETVRIENYCVTVTKSDGRRVEAAPGEAEAARRVLE